MPFIWNMTLTSIQSLSKFGEKLLRNTNNNRQLKHTIIKK